MPARRPTAGRQRAPVRYRIKLADLLAHLYQVEIEIDAPQILQTLSLPVWIPGSYLVREFSRSLQKLAARQGRRPVASRQLDKNTWSFDCAPAQTLSVRYEVAAIDPSPRSAWLDATRGFFNGTSLCLRVHGKEDLAHGLTLLRHPARRRWRAASVLPAVGIDEQGFGEYLADGYDQLVDCPFEIGDFQDGAFSACGVPHRFVVSGAGPSFDAERLLADARSVCETAIRFWHGAGKPAPANYLFLLHAASEGLGGLEHRDCAALQCARRDLPQLAQHRPAGAPAQPAEARPGDGYRDLLALISHEYFHAWNIKRLRPLDLDRPRYDIENYTELLWFFEGFTSYYDELLLRRAGLCDDLAYLKKLGRTINQVLQTPGRLVQSLAQASFDAWVKFYRPDGNQVNATVNYYTKGALVALCLDLTLRQESEGKASLDDVMRLLWQRSQGGTVTEPDILAALASVGRRGYEHEIASWAHGTADLPLRGLLERQGLLVLEEEAPMAQRLGLRVDEAQGIRVKTVLRGSAAEQAGFAAGDEWLAVDDWRLTRLDDLTQWMGRKSTTQAWVARDQRLLRLRLAMPPAFLSWRLQVRDNKLLQAWLAPDPVQMPTGS
jgi:predicted metalloprotease with PDZ domain